MTAPIKVVIAGASGRMGHTLIETVLNHKACQLSAALERKNSAYIGLDAGLMLGKTTGILISSDLQAALINADVLIDFTRPEGTLAYLDACIASHTNIIIGTTGFDEHAKSTILQAATKIGVVCSPNFSVGVNLSFALLDTAARVLNEGYDIEIIEAHHRYKVDAPSGTALRMGEVIAAALGRDLSTCAIYGREGITGQRDPNTIGFSTIRAGDIVGDHTVLFGTMGEQIEITHKASNRSTFAAGAIRAALWLQTKNTGLFDMQDVLGLKNP